MPNDYFQHVANRITDNTRALASQVNNIADEVEQGFDLLPDNVPLLEGRYRYAVDAGAADAYSITVGVTVTLTDGLAVRFRAQNANTGASTLDVNSTGIRNLVNSDGSALAAGAILANMIVEAVYNSSSNAYELQSPSALLGAAGGLSGAGTPVADQVGVFQSVNTIGGSSDLVKSAAQFIAGNYTFNTDQSVGAPEDGFVMTYNDASGELELQAGGGAGGAWVELIDRAITAVADEDITFDETLYTKIMIDIEDLQPGTDAVNITLQMGHSNGGTIINSGYDGLYATMESNAWTDLTPSASVLLANSMGNGAGETFNAHIEFTCFRSANTGGFLEINTLYVNSVANTQARKIHAWQDTNAAVMDTIRISTSSGVFNATGRIRVWGLAE